MRCYLREKAQSNQNIVFFFKGNHHQEGGGHILIMMICVAREEKGRIETRIYLLPRARSLRKRDEI